MAGVNAYGATSNGNSIWGTDKNGNNVVKSDSNLNMDDFLNLLTAQMSNQDPMNPSTDMEFIGQMAQFTSLQAMKTLTELTMAQHGAGLIGKYVVVAHVDDRGALVEERGQISNVKFMGGTVSITVNDNEYEMSSVMEVLTEEEFNKPPATDKPDEESPETEKSKSGNVEVKSASAYGISDELQAEIAPFLQQGYKLADPVNLNYGQMTADNQETGKVITPVGEVNVQSATSESARTTVEESRARAEQLKITNPELYAEIEPYLRQGYRLAAPATIDYNSLFPKE